MRNPFTFTGGVVLVILVALAILLAFVIAYALSPTAAGGSTHAGGDVATVRGRYSSPPASTRPAPVAETLPHGGATSPKGEESPLNGPGRSSDVAPPMVYKMRVTAYCPCSICCGRWADGITASGEPVTTNGGKLVAAPRHLPLGTMVSIPGYNGGKPVPVLDRGGAIRRNRLDVFFPTHQEALEWGVQYLDVTIDPDTAGTERDSDGGD